MTRHVQPHLAFEFLQSYKSPSPYDRVPTRLNRSLYEVRYRALEERRARRAQWLPDEQDGEFEDYDAANRSSLAEDPHTPSDIAGPRREESKCRQAVFSMSRPKILRHKSYRA